MVVILMQSLPIGFRFRPTDEELINHYLRYLVASVTFPNFSPMILGLSVIKIDDPEWFFFYPCDRKYPDGHRSNMATEAGYWKLC
ncbi:Protein NTM1-like 9 [Linum perenne]